jgi:uncharacterized integral membrane protein
VPGNGCNKSHEREATWTSRRWLRLLIAVVFLLVLMIFDLSNREPVTIGFWPTEVRRDVPLSRALLIVVVVALVIGAAIVWISEVDQRRRRARPRRGCGGSRRKYGN